MTQEEIKQFNKNLENKGIWDQGIFVEPFGIDVKEKRPVLYLRYETGGVSGGSCWDYSDPQPYYNDKIPNWVALDNYLFLKYPNISYLEYKKVESMVKSNDKTEYEYYGNCTDYIIKWIAIEDLDNFLIEERII